MFQLSKRLLMAKNSWLVGAGFVLCLISLSFSVAQSFRKRPGELRTKTPSLEWKSTEKTSTKSWAQGVVTFEIENCGESEVRILSLERGCGCVDAKMRSDSIPPGGLGFLDVTASPQVIGEKRVTIRLATDSLLTPKLNLDLKVVGTRRPPYLLSAAGDLNFLDCEPGASDEFEVTSVAHSGEDREVKLECDLPFAQIEKVSLIRKPSVDDPNVLYHIRRYRLRLKENLSEQSFQGRVQIGDPWDPERFLTVPISGLMKPAFRVVPTRLRFDLSGPGEGSPDRNFVVIRRNRVRETQIEVERESDSPLLIERSTTSDASQGEPFRVRLKPGTPRGEGVFNLIVRDPEGKSKPITLPVEIRGGSAR